MAIERREALECGSSLHLSLVCDGSFSLLRSVRISPTGSGLGVRVDARRNLPPAPEDHADVGVGGQHLQHGRQVCQHGEDDVVPEVCRLQAAYTCALTASRVIVE